MEFADEGIEVDGLNRRGEGLQDAESGQVTASCSPARSRTRQGSTGLLVRNFDVAGRMGCYREERRDDKTSR